MNVQGSYQNIFADLAKIQSNNIPKFEQDLY